MYCGQSCSNNHESGLCEVVTWVLTAPWPRVLLADFALAYASTRAECKYTCAECKYTCAECKYTCTECKYMYTCTECKQQEKSEQ